MRSSCCGSLCKGVLVSTIFSGLSLTGAQTCQPLCSFDAQYTQSCQISRWYSASLLQRLRGDSVWGEIAAQGLTCESLNGSACENATLCRISGAGCATDRAWIARKLASPVWQGGAGLGAQKCGECIELQSEADCAGYNGTAGCLWDPGRASCGIPPATVLALLRQEFRDELVRVALRRDRCASLASQDLCKGSCLWDAAGMKCNLQPLEALLAVIDEDCPLRSVLSAGSACADLSESSCLALGL
ncbi:GRC3, partial [Symbiodinium pilosum]